MINKIVFSAALVVASVSGALAWDNVGEIANPQDPAVMQTQTGFNAYGAVRRSHATMQTRETVPQTNPTAYNAGDVSNQ